MKRISCGFLILSLFCSLQACYSGWRCAATVDVEEIARAKLLYYSFGCSVVLFLFFATLALLAGTKKK